MSTEQNFDSLLAARMSRRAFLRRGAIAGGSIGLASLLAACGGSSDSSSPTEAPAAPPPSEPEPAAPAEEPAAPAGSELAGEIKFLNLPGWLGANTVANFQTLHPDVKITEVALDYTTSAGPAGQVIQDPDAYDMIFLDSAGIGQLDAASLITKITPANLENYAKILPALQQAYPWGIATDTGQIGIGYRTDVVKEPITSWADFWKVVPNYSGQVVLIDFDRDLIGNALIYLGFDGNSTNPDELEQAKQAVLELKPHSQAFKVLELGKSLLDKSAAITMGYDWETASAMKEDPNIAWVAPSEGMIAYVEGWSAIATTDHLDVIESFMDFFLEDENVADFVATVGAPVSTGANADEITAIQSNAQFIKFLGEEATKQWSEAWNEIKSA